MLCSVFFSLFNNWEYFIYFSIEDFPPLLSNYLLVSTIWTQDLLEDGHSGKTFRLVFSLPFFLTSLKTEVIILWARWQNHSHSQGLQSLSEQPVPPHKNKGLYWVQMRCPMVWFVSLASRSGTGHHWEEPGSGFFTPCPHLEFMDKILLSFLFSPSSVSFPLYD